MREENVVPRLVIIGSRGIGREVLWVVRDCNRAGSDWDILGFIDDDIKVHGKTFCDLPVVGGLEWIRSNMSTNLWGICAIGNTETRYQIHQKASSIGLKFATLIHPSVRMSQYVEIGEGVVICAGCILTTQISIGDHVYINLNCTIGHDTRIDNYVNCAPACNISGGVHLNQGAHLFTGVKIGPGVNVGNWSQIGAGSVVLKDVPDNVTVAGIPAKIIKRNRG